jgi:hypothetical protein
MTQPPSADPPDKGAPLDPVTARIVLCLDDAISAFRAGEGTGLPALDSASRLIGELTDDASTSAATLRGERPRVPGRPDRVELAILTALADTYGSEILTNASLGYARAWLLGMVAWPWSNAFYGANPHLICSWPRCWALHAQRSPRSRWPSVTI